MLYLLEANVSIRVAGISAPFMHNITWLVNGRNSAEAKQKFENRVRNDFAHMMPQSISFEWIKVAGEIK